MKSSERVNLTLDHKEPDRVPYDLAGTTVTGINKKAYIKAMQYRGLSQEYDKKEIDPVQQIVTPVEEILQKLSSDIRPIGSRRIPDYLRTVIIPRFGSLWSNIRKRLPHVKIFMHTCGSVRILLPGLIETGLDILNPVQFTAANMELEGLKKDFGNDLVFWGGGVDTQ